MRSGFVGHPFPHHRVEFSHDTIESARMASTPKEGDTIRGLEKRKACDLCHVKKIRCDSKRPTCSHCVVYGAKCAYTPHIKKRKARGEIKVQTKYSSTSIHIFPASNGLLTANGSVTTAVEVEVEVGLSQTVPNQGVGPPPVLSSSRRDEGDTAGRGLPPLTKLLPYIQDYFAGLNCAFPIFDQDRLLSMLEEGEGGQESPILTAATNVILALALQLRRSGDSSVVTPLDIQRCVKNAESVLSVTTDRQSDLLALQVRLGLMLLHQSTFPSAERQTALSSLVAGAIQLSHRQGLHYSRANELFTPEDALQRSRVFWLLYVLDRDISMRSGGPPLQRHDDFDVPIPFSTPGNGVLTLWDKSGSEFYFDILASRIALAHIQGSIYDELHSVQASYRSEETIQLSMSRLHSRLKEWFETIPSPLLPEKLAAMTPHTSVRQIIALYFSYLSCVQHIYKLGAHDAEWITRLVDYSEWVTKMDDQDFLKPPTPAARPFLGPSSSWANIVNLARQCARLFRLVECNDSALIWYVRCTPLASAALQNLSLATGAYLAHTSPECSY